MNRDRLRGYPESSNQTMRRRMWILAIGLAAVVAAWFAVRAVETWRFRHRAAPGAARLERAAVRFGPGAFGPAGAALARPGRSRVFAWRMRDGQGPYGSRPGGLGPCSGPGPRGSPRGAVTRPGRHWRRPLPARRDVPRPRDPPGGRPRQRGAAAPRRTFTGSPAGTTSTEASCAASSTTRAIPPRPCACSGASTTSRIRSKRMRETARKCGQDGPRRRPRLARAWPTWRPVPDASTRPATGSRAASGPSPTTPRSGARLDWAQAAGRPDELMRAADTSARFGLAQGAVARALRLVGRAERRSPGRARGPRNARRPRAGRCRRPRATG